MNSLHSAELLIQSTKKLDLLGQSEDIQEIAKQIQKTKENLTVLGDLPQFNQTQQQLVKLQNRLEGMARPLLRNALARRNTEEVIVLIGLFQQMEREYELIGYFDEFYIEKAAELWEQLTDGMQEKENSFREFIAMFYDKFAELLDTQVRWAHKLLPTKYHLLSEVVVKSMAKVEGAYQSFLQQQVDSGDQCSKRLIELWNIAVHFSNQSIGVVGALPEQKLEFMIDSIFSPFLPFQNNFAVVMTKRLSFELNRSILMKPTEFAQTITWMEERIPRMFHLCEEAVAECIAFTGGVEAEQFMKTLSDTFVRFLENWLIALQFLRVQSKVDIVESNTTNSNVMSYDQSFSQDWTFVQGALEVLRSSKLFSSKFNSFDGFLRTKFITQGHVLLNSTSEDVQLQFFQRLASKDSSTFSVFQERLSDGAFQLLSTPHRMLVTFDTRVQSFVFDTMFQFIKEKLATVPGLKVSIL